MSIHKDSILMLARLIRPGNSLNAERSTYIRQELERVAELLIDTDLDMGAIVRVLHSIIQNQKQIMDQNAAISGALDKLGADISAELAKIAGSIQPGMSDVQAQAIVDRITGFDAQIQAVLAPQA